MQLEYDLLAPISLGFQGFLFVREIKKLMLPRPHTFLKLIQIAENNRTDPQVSS